MSAAKVLLLTSKHQPGPKAVTKPKPNPVPNSENLIFWPGNDTQANGGVPTPASDHSSRQTDQPPRVKSPVIVHQQTGRVDCRDKRTRVALSDDRLEHTKKAHDVKTPWTEKDAVYYDSVSTVCLL